MKKVRDTLGGQPNIHKFVDHKLALYERSDRTMAALYPLMFSEEDNIMGESTDGYRHRQVTYGESRRSTDQKTAQLMGLLSGVPQGALVGLYLDNSMDWIEFFWAILQAGYRPLLMNTRLPDGVLEEVVGTYHVEAVISADKSFSTRNLHVEDIARADGSAALDPARFENEIFLMSSNTSGHLKLCGYTGEQFYHQIRDSALIIKESKSIKKHYHGSLKLLTFLPFYHIFGLVAVYIWFCFFSRTLFFLKDYAPKTILNTIKRHEITHVFAVPVLWERLYRTAISTIRDRGDKTWEKFQRGMRLSKTLSGVPLVGRLFVKRAFREVRDNIFGESALFLINGGGYISPEAMSFINGIGYHLVNGYGMTELGITSVELSEKAKVRNLCSVGRPFSSLEYRINEEGELLVRGKSIACSIRSEGQDLTVKEGEWFNTHDLFVLRNGRYYIQGRKDDLIICSNGENVNPDLTEPKLRTDGVEALCLIPSSHVEGKLILVAEVSRYTDRARLTHLRQSLTEKLVEQGLDGVADRIVLTSTPLMEANDFKISRKKTARRLGAGELRIMDLDAPQAEFDEADRELLERVTAIFASSLDKAPGDIPPDAHFFLDLGGTSLDYFTMVAAVQSEFEISFPVAGGTSASTVREMMEFIKSKLNHETAG